MKAQFSGKLGEYLNEFWWKVKKHIFKKNVMITKGGKILLTKW